MAFVLGNYEAIDPLDLIEEVSAFELEMRDFLLEQDDQVLVMTESGETDSVVTESVMDTIKNTIKRVVAAIVKWAKKAYEFFKGIWEKIKIKLFGEYTVAVKKYGKLIEKHQKEVAERIKDINMTWYKEDGLNYLTKTLVPLIKHGPKNDTNAKSKDEVLDALYKEFDLDSTKPVIEQLRAKCLYEEDYVKSGDGRETFLGVKIGPDLVYKYLSVCLDQGRHLKQINSNLDSVKHLNNLGQVFGKLGELYMKGVNKTDMDEKDKFKATAFVIRSTEYRKIVHSCITFFQETNKYILTAATSTIIKAGKIAMKIEEEKGVGK